MSQLQEQLFKDAAQYLQTHDVHVERKDKLKLYAHFKQATEGDCNIAMPGLWDFVNRKKYDAWNLQRGTKKEDAMKAYVELVESLQVGWSCQGEYKVEQAQNTKEKEGMGNFVSSMAKEQEEEPVDLIGFARQNNLQKVKNHITVRNEPVNTKDDEGLTALHHASDRGYIDIITLLLKFNANINATTNQNETALHYACISEQLLTAQLLIEKGCDTTIRDSEGLTAFEQAEPSFVAQLKDLLSAASY